VFVTVTHGVSVVGVPGWPVILTGWPAGRLAGWPAARWRVTVGVISQPAADAERYRCACLHCIQRLAGRGDGYSAASTGGVVGWLEFNVPFQHKYGYIRDDDWGAF